MRHIVYLWPAPVYNIFSPHYLIKDTIFGKKKIIEHKMCVLIFSTNLVWKFSLPKKNSERCYHKCTYIGLHVKYRLFLSGFNENRIFWTDFEKKKSIPNFMKIRSVGVQLFVAGRRTDVRHGESKTILGILRTFLTMPWCIAPLAVQLRTDQRK